jgi:sugar (pentulose or hexulose) kinase
VGTEEYTSVREACKVAIREVRTFEPRAEEGKIYAEGHRRYQALYPAIRSSLTDRVPAG